MNEEGTWQQLVKRKYLKDKTLTCSQATRWLSVLVWLNGSWGVSPGLGKFVVTNGEQVRFWEDWWKG
jgi:hypothetical protein